MYVDNSYSNDNYNSQNGKSKNILYILIITILALILVLGLVYLFNGNSFKFGNKDEKEVPDIFLNETNLYLQKGETGQIELTVFPENIDTSTFTWKSDNDNIAVSNDGVVYAREAGEANITITGNEGQEVTVQVTVSEEDSKIEDIKLDKTSLELEVGEVYNFTISTTPLELDFDPVLTWTTSDDEVLSVDEGVVKALNPGTSTVTVKTKNDKESKCTVIVKEKEILPTNITLSVNDIALNVGDDFDIEAFYEPFDVTNKNTTWKSSDEDVVSVNDGKIKALQSGISIITATTKNDKSASCIIIVKGNESSRKEEVVATSVTLDKNNVTLDVGESLKLNATINPNNVDDKSITWSSSNPDVASVDLSGFVTSKNKGTTTITVKTNNDKVATCIINVVKIDIKTFDQRNDAVISYYSGSTKEIKKIYKNMKCNDKSNRCDIPKTYHTSITGNIKLYEYDEKTKTKKLIKTVSQEMLQYNMVPNIVYYLESESAPNNNEYVKLTGDLRMIDIAKIRNVRDIGGYQADGGFLKYGKVYRGANPSYVLDIDKATEIFKDLGIGVVLDLRSSSDFRKVKKYYASLEKINSVSGYYLSSSKLSGTVSAVTNVMNSVVNGKGIYFHCAIGTDRTGTVGYLIEGILGVSNETRLDDYELSYFYKHASGTHRNGSAITGMYKKINKYSGVTEQEKFINWYLNMSSNKEEAMNLINKFRKAMINGNPTTYKVQNGVCVAA